MKLLLPLLLLAVTLAACTQAGEKEETKTIGDASFSTFDGWDIAATQYTNDGRGIILLHQLDGDRNQWATFAKRLQREGYSVLTIDLRGHGSSTGTPQSWQQFTAQDFRRMTRDVEAAQEFLAEDNLTLIGASIGANVAARYAAAHPETVGALVLLSPGTAYRGLTTADIIRDVKAPLFMAASSEDSFADASADELVQLAPHAQRERLHNKGHGVELLQDDIFTETLLDWLRANFPTKAPPPENATNVTLPVVRR